MLLFDPLIIQSTLNCLLIERVLYKQTWPGVSQVSCSAGPTGTNAEPVLKLCSPAKGQNLCFYRCDCVSRLGTFRSLEAQRAIKPADSGSLSGLLYQGDSLVNSFWQQLSMSDSRADRASSLCEKWLPLVQLLLCYAVDIQEVTGGVGGTSEAMFSCVLSWRLSLMIDCWLDNYSSCTHLSCVDYIYWCEKTHPLHK